LTKVKYSYNLKVFMPFRTGDDVKSGVIYEWLRGSSRDKIAAIYNISTGAVTNIKNEWRNNIGAYIAEDLRELSISLKKANITPIHVLLALESPR
jgi:hypothetical protein